MGGASGKNKATAEQQTQVVTKTGHINLQKTLVHDHDVVGLQVDIFLQVFPIKKIIIVKL